MQNFTPTYLIFLKTLDEGSEEAGDVQSLSPKARRRNLEEQAECSSHLLDVGMDSFVDRDMERAEDIKNVEL